VAPLEALFAEERRCPRCGAFLREDRREGERRQSNRRANPQDDPGPPKPKRKAKGDGTASGERRVEDRRSTRRRGSGKPPADTERQDPPGLRD